MIRKIIKWLLISLILLSIILVSSIVFYLRSVNVYVTEQDLPEGVYDSNSSVNMLMLSAVTSILVADEDEVDPRIEFFMNVLIYKTIKDDINPDYDPINGETKESQYISKNLAITLDYIFVELTDDDQLLLSVSMKRHVFPKVATAMYLYFDMDFSYETMDLLLTLDRVLFDDKEVSQTTYDFVLNLMNKEKIINSVDRGRLDFDDYTYSIGFRDYFSPF